MNNDNWNLRDPGQRHAYILQCILDHERADKAASPLASLSDRGIDLTPDEERDVRAYALKMGASFDEVADEMAATYTIIGDRTHTKMFESLVRKNVLPRNLLALFMKNRMFMRAMARS